MAWEKSKAFLEKVQISSIVLYLICLGGYAIPIDALHETYDSIRADIFGSAGITRAPMNSPAEDKKMI